MLLRHWLFFSFLGGLLAFLSQPTVGDQEHPEGVSVDVLALEYPPFLSKNMPSSGYAFELLESKLTGYSIEPNPVIVPPARAQRMIRTGRWCVSFYPPKQGPLSSNFFPLGETIDVLLISVSEPESFSIQDEQKFEGRSVAVLRPEKHGTIHQKLITTGLRLVYVESIYQGLDMLQKGRVDFSMGDKYSTESYQRDRGSEIDFRFSREPLVSTPIGVFLNEKCDLFDQLKSALNAPD